MDSYENYENCHSKNEDIMGAEMFLKELQYFSFFYFFDTEWSLIFKKLRAGKTLLRSKNDSPQNASVKHTRAVR